MSLPDPTRRELEESVRALLPRTGDISQRLRNARTSTAGVGLGALVTGYAWGWRRGRRSRRR